MSGPFADQWLREPAAREAGYVDDLIDQHCADAALLRAILADAIAKISRLDNILVWPVATADRDGTLTQLRDLMPPATLDEAHLRAAEDVAWDRVKDARL